MKQIVSNYSYSPTTNVVTLTGVNIEQDQLLLVVAPQVGRTMYNFASGVTGAVSAGADTRVTLNASTVGLTTTSPLVIFYDDQASTQTIAGTVTATLNLSNLADGQAIGIPLQYNNSSDSDAATVVNIYKAPGSDTGGLPIQNTKNSVDESIIPLAISGTVTANLQVPGVGVYTFIAESGGNSPAYAVGIGYNTENNTEFLAVNDTGNNLPVAVNNSVTIGSLPTLAPQLPRVTFVDGSGTVTTANTAITVFASSSTRSYLLVQVTTGSAFVNVGATATTVNGINLTAGQGYAWETTIPQGIVSLISTTTSSRYVAKEA